MITAKIHLTYTPKKEHEEEKFYGSWYGAFWIEKRKLNVRLLGVDLCLRVKRGYF